jgi:hypothetical protein
MKAFLILPVLFVFLVQPSFASDYQSYEQVLEKNWPIPNPQPWDCQSHNPYYWMDKAQRMISVEPIKKMQKLSEDEVMVIRNLLISRAYNSLFTYSLRTQNTDLPQVKFIWMAAGSQASVTVGHALQAGLASAAPRFSKARENFRKLEKMHDTVPVLPNVLLRSIDKIKNKTAENNWRVFSDIFWQHLAYTNCGLDEVVLLNQKMVEEKLRLNRYQEKFHYERFIALWQDMEAGKYLQANMKLIWIEQHNILQKHMYDGLDAKAANAMLLFNQMAKADLKGPGGRHILSFNEFSWDRRKYPNLGYFPLRFKWMKYVVGEQAAYLQELGTVPEVEEVMTPSLRESAEFIGFYLH